MKLFNLTRFLKSEFKPEKNYREIFRNNGFYHGRMIGSSKSEYCQSHPDNVIIFNANVVTKKSGKVWYGDLDITLDFDNLKNTADELGEDLYVLKEHDARFENDKAGFKFWKENAVEIIKARK